MSNRLFCVVFLVLSLALCGAGCAKKVASSAGGMNPPASDGAENGGPDESSTDDFAPSDTRVHPDSLEKLNRKVFSFNDVLISYVFTPVHTVYAGFFPPDMRNGFSNFYRNIAFPIRFVNALLQFKFDKMFKETASFVLNTTFGSAGFFNVTKNMASLQSSPEDFGQTLAFYGVGSGTYVVLPLLGPSSVRDTVGLVADSLLYPLTWVQPDTTKYAFTAHDKTNTISANMKTYQDIKAESLDHYTSMKDVYFQYRQGLEAE
ncbi:MAG: VacJ family lipoprotein [Deltaproteobacteria bacterium]|nr:VacJ family lipoprotein [Deltaproteobacteria bacterium]